MVYKDLLEFVSNFLDNGFRSEKFFDCYELEDDFLHFIVNGDITRVPLYTPETKNAIHFLAEMTVSNFLAEGELV